MEYNCIDLMAKGDSHCCHHLGILKYYPEYKLFIHNSSGLMDANNYYNGANFDLNNVKFMSLFYLYFFSIKSLLLRHKIIFTGLHLRQAIILFPLLAFNKNTTIHLHGQTHGIKNNFIKYLLWRLISWFASLEVSNPSWIGPSFIKIIKNINELHYPDTLINNNIVLFYSQKGNKPNDLNKLKQKLKENDYELLIINSGVSYFQLNKMFKAASFIYLDYCDDYYCYSPCGHISDAINYGLTIVLNSDDYINISVVQNYNVKYLLL
jgi:hypothetical protein